MLETGDREKEETHPCQISTNESILYEKREPTSDKDNNITDLRNITDIDLFIQDHLSLLDIEL